MSAEPRQVIFQTSGKRLAVRRPTRPRPRGGEVIATTVAVGIDGTDEDLVNRRRASPPKGQDHLVLGHEALGRLPNGGLVVPLVRLGCGSCAACRKGHADWCPTDDFLEHGLKGKHGFMRPNWAAPREQLVDVPAGLGVKAVLTEPLSIIAKAWQTYRAIDARLPDGIQHDQTEVKALVTGSGSLGAMAILLLRHHGVPTWVVDRSGDEAASTKFAKKLGADHVDSNEQSIRDLGEEADGFDLILETTAAPEVALEAHTAMAGNGALCLLGIMDSAPSTTITMNRVWTKMVRRNQLVYGSVNSSRQHFEAALGVLDKRAGWARQALTHRFRPDQAREAFEAKGDDVIKKAIVWEDA